MGKNSKIGWTHHTFNPWWGCAKVSPACASCYAEAFAIRTGKKVWGAEAPRRLFGDGHWLDPVKWNAEAETLPVGEQRRVFCASMADVFEDRPDLAGERRRLWALIEATPRLTWLLLTKRTQHVAQMVPSRWFGMGWPQHVWLGATAEDQKHLDQRSVELVNVPAAIPVRFLSMEPLLEGAVLREPALSGVQWVIVGGESGARVRPMEESWVRSLRGQCVRAGIAFFYKQTSGFRPDTAPLLDGVRHDAIPDPVGDRLAELRVRGTPSS